MVTKKQIVVSAVVVTGIGLGAYALYQFTQSQQSLMDLVIDVVGIGGTTNPAPNTYSYPLGQSIDIQAVPDAGYYVKEWRVDGNSLGNSNTLPLWMNTSHIVEIEFSTTPPPPPPQNPPAAIQNVTTPQILDLIQPYAGWWEYYSDNPEVYVVNKQKWHFDPLLTDITARTPDPNKNNWLGNIPSDQIGYVSSSLRLKVTDYLQQPLNGITIEAQTSYPNLNAGLFIGQGRYNTTWATAITNSEGIASFGISYRHLDLATLSIERCYNKRWKIFIPDPWVTCLGINTDWTICDMALMNCTGEENGITMNDVCPNATQYGPDLQYTTITFPHVITARVASVPAIQLSAQANCRYTVRNLH